MEENVITLNDVSVMIKIIDVCAKRGAIHSDEFLVVGDLLRKLKTIVLKEESETELQKTND